MKYSILLAAVLAAVLVTGREPGPRPLSACPEWVDVRAELDGWERGQDRRVAERIGILSVQCGSKKSLGWASLLLEWGEARRAEMALR